MKRFVLVLALVAVSGATYVATAPGSQTAGPTAAQFRALKKQVAGLKKQVGLVKALAGAEAVLLTDCMKKAQPVDQFGNGSTTGYEYKDPAVSPDPTLTKAVNYADPSDPTALWITGGDSTCGTDINAAALRKAIRLAGVPVRH